MSITEEVDTKAEKGRAWLTGLDELHSVMVESPELLACSGHASVHLNAPYDQDEAKWVREVTEAIGVKPIIGTTTTDYVWVTWPVGVHQVIAHIKADRIGHRAPQPEWVWDVDTQEAS